MIKPRKKAVKAPERSEEVEQAMVVHYLNYVYPSVKYCASAGGVRTSIKQAIKMKRTGYVKGFPDIQICKAVGGYHGLFIEMKRMSGTLDKSQKEWLAALNNEGYLARCCKGFDSAKLLIDQYLHGEIQK